MSFFFFLPNLPLSAIFSKASISSGVKPLSWAIFSTLNKCFCKASFFREVRSLTRRKKKIKIWDESRCNPCEQQASRRRICPLAYFTIKFYPLNIFIRFIQFWGHPSVYWLWALYKRKITHIEKVTIDRKFKLTQYQF